jgi:hypothetical protein
VSSVASEAMDILVANERLAVLGKQLAGSDMIGILQVAPILAPELEAIGERIDEGLGHVEAAQAVLKARLAILRGDE